MLKCRALSAQVVALAALGGGLGLQASDSRQLASSSPRAKAAQVEAMSPDRFAEAHAPIFEPPKSKDVGALTERVAPSGRAIARLPLAPRNYIDEHIFGKMKRDGVPHAPLSNDYEFVRRVTLDLTGRIPTASEVRSFVADTDPEKRRKLIDRLLNSEAFVDKWAYFFMDLFRANGKMGRGQNLFHYWMKENLRADRPYDDVVRDLIAASAKSNHVVAASNVIAREHVQGKAQPDDGKDFGMVHQLDTHDELAVLYAKTFLGINLSCISCHDGRGHLEKVNLWLSQRKRSDFYQFAAFLGNSRYLMYWEDGKPQSGEFMIDDENPGYDSKGKSMIRVPRFGGPSLPAFILTGEQPRQGEPPREALGRMLTTHPQFARATANLFWSRLMGFGIVEPYDEFDLVRYDTAPEGWQPQASHPELLNALADDFRRNGYRLKRLIATICNSNAYQLSARFEGEWKDSYTRYYARKFVRQLTAEEVHDSIVVATGRPGNFNYGGQKVPMAMQMSGPAGGGEVRYFMQTFGQSNRSNPPKPPVGSPLQALLLMQSSVVNDRVLAKNDSRVQQLLETYADDGRLVEEMFLGVLGREVSEKEKEIALAELRRNRTEGAQNLQWALINSIEFLFNK
ncbi:MAG: DUF1549 and DUF1553 domain-containing protein [Bryobacteraceae bacterium]|nr:DUF1549 and DUF1553 domain-containing protein [Bryobacteraceae bacterium]MDW8379980.1 DUF1549 domain-containing protein [Bryobacterales bacterium]